MNGGQILCLNGFIAKIAKTKNIEEEWLTVIEFRHTAMGSRWMEATSAATVADQSQSRSNHDSIYFLAIEPRFIETSET